MAMKKVLVVDDELFARRNLKRLLEPKEDLEIIEADNAVTAFSVYNDQKPDFVILDISMPRMGGDELMNVILATDEKAKIIVCSGKPRSEMRKYISMGAKFFVSKPINSDNLYYCVDKLCSRI